MFHRVFPSDLVGKVKVMFLRCVRCKDRAVLDEAVAKGEWRRTCTSCGFVYTIRAEPELFSLDRDLMDLAIEANGQVSFA